jgi:hypothetical protein
MLLITVEMIPIAHKFSGQKAIKRLSRSNDTALEICRLAPQGLKWMMVRK